jgi:uncharacterized RDD family membrane protein YckC
MNQPKNRPATKGKGPTSNLIEASDGKAPLAPASKILLSAGIDIAWMAFVVTRTFKYFPVENIFPESSLSMQYIYIILYLVIIFKAIPVAIFAQTPADVLVGIRVVSRNKHEKLNIIQAINHNLMLSFLANSVVVENK